MSAPAPLTMEQVADIWVRLSDRIESRDSAFGDDPLNSDEREIYDALTKRLAESVKGKAGR